MSFFVSTRGASPKVDAPHAILNGIAPDGGLYIPETLPRITPESLQGLDFIGMAKAILTAYLPGYTAEEIDACVDAAYSGKFDVPDIAPVKKVGKHWVLELFHGPTAAFKDVALSVLPRLMSTAMKKTGFKNRIMILTATSGDTGSAALTGFSDVEGIGITVFYPNEGISPIQRAQMTAMKGDNLHVCAVKGNFDDAQSGVKQIFAEMEQNDGVSLSSANSINFGRLAPQIVYYYSSYLKLVEEGVINMGDPVDFCVPTGNFGDILAGYFARCSGLPVARLLCASNRNNVLTDFLASGCYDRNRPFHVTLSPSMDILISSNLERLVYLALGRDGAKTAELMAQLKKDGRYTLPEDAFKAVQSAFEGAYVTDEEALKTIARVWKEEGYLLDPHSAVAYRAAEELEGEVPCVVLSTASPFKFPSTVLTALDLPIPEDAAEQLKVMEDVCKASAPETLSSALTRPVRFRDVVAPAEMQAYVAEAMKA